MVHGNYRNRLATLWLPPGNAMVVARRHIRLADWCVWVLSVVEERNWVMSEDNCRIETTIEIGPS